MKRPSTSRLFVLFARTAARRFVNRFLYAWSKRAEARRRRRGILQTERTATVHRQQRFRSGSILAILFSAYLIFALGTVMNASFTRAMIAIAERAKGSPDAVMPEKRDAAFSPRQLSQSDRPWEEEEPFYKMDPATRQTGVKVAALMMFIAGAGTLLFSVGVLSRQVNRPVPSLSWLFEFPVPRKVLFSSKLSECLFDSAALPMLSVLPGIVLFHSGATFWTSVALGLAFGLIMSLTVSALRISAEVLLLQKLSRRRRGTITGVCAAIGVLGNVIVLFGGGTPALLNFLLWAADMLPAWFYFNPLTAGFGSGASLAVQWGISAAVTGLICAGAVSFCSRLTRFGLEPGLETARGSAPRHAPAAARRILSGLPGKELLMLVRQRTVLVQVILAPLIMVLMMYFQTEGRLADRALRSDGALASTIYGICAYMVLIASQVAMNTELRTLWLLLSLPRPLADSLRTKSFLWGTAAAALAFVLTVIAMLVRQDFASGMLVRLPFLLLFVALIADLSVGLRTMGSSIVSETTIHFRQWAAWLPLMLSAAAGQAVFSGDMWNLCVQLVLLGALDVSVWQKLKVELPYLTEPAEDPPPRLYLMHGQLAAYGYLALQQLGVLLALALRLPVAAVSPLAAGFAAATVAVLTFWILTRRKVRILPEAVAPAGRSFAMTGAAVVAGCAVGFFWMKLLEHIPGAAEKLEQSRSVLRSVSTTGDRVGLIVLGVIVAPVCEEFIFRGLVYQGLRRTGGVAFSVLWSSLFFTAVHPPASSVAVFLLAAGNAMVMERTGRLSACIVVHAAYNTFILLLQAAT